MKLNQKLKSIKSFFTGIGLSLMAGALITGCGNSGGNIVKDIHIGLHNDNVLQIQIDVNTIKDAKAYVEYWSDSLGDAHSYRSNLSDNGTTHSFVLENILPNTAYSFRVITDQDNKEIKTKKYQFQSQPLPMWLKDQFKYSAVDPASLPESFKNGFMLMNKREAPGLVYLVDYLGRLRWYHMVNGTGFKVSHFTHQNSIISILGQSDEPTSYGSEILEINLKGDTLTHLKKGQNDFKYTLHHEIIKHGPDEILTIYEDKRPFDLRYVGGGAKDTVNGDGILLMDKEGHKLWQWSVFDEINPLSDPHIVKNRKDWLHANSLNYDLDSNYLLSFYNIGQIWKIDAHTGKVLWKMGKGGNIKLPADCEFTQSHTVHINPYGKLMFFDNGVEKQQSEVFAFAMNEQEKRADADLHFKLPKEIYNGRMGSAYMINDSLVLCCCSKRHITVLSNRKGVLLWTLETAIPPYRVQFVPADGVKPYLSN
jgi:hypothetical protein